MSNQSTTPYDYMALIQAAEKQANEGCGLSDVLYEGNRQSAFAYILAKAPEAMKDETETALLRAGFDPDFEPYEAKEGECSLTGIDEDCCPCGRHP